MGKLIKISSAKFVDPYIFTKVDIPACSHSYQSVVTAPDCVNGGYTTCTCANCGDKYVADYTDALGHNYVDGYCTRCDAEDPDYVHTCQHEYDNACDTTCNLCGYVRRVKHSYGAGVVTLAPSCIVGGVKTYTCAICGNSYTEAIPAKGHTFGAGVPTKPPSCTEAGEITYTCTDCGATKTESINALGHKYDDGEVTKAPDCTNDGEITYTCSVCGDSYTEAIRATGHTYVDGVCTICGAKDPTHVTIADYPDIETDTTLKGLYDLGGTLGDTLECHASHTHSTAHTAAEKIDGTYTIEDSYVSFSGATNKNRMHTYLRLPLANKITYIVLFRVPSGNRVLMGNRSGGDGSNGNGLNLRNDCVEYSLNGVLTPQRFPAAINSANNFAILAVTASPDGFRAVRYTNDKLVEQAERNAPIEEWLVHPSSGNAVQIAGYGKSSFANSNAHIALAAIHDGDMPDDKLERICEFVKLYGERKGLTVV